MPKSETAEMKKYERKRVRIFEKNKRIIRFSAPNSPDPVERDIAWTLKYVQDAYPWTGVEGCIAGLALSCCDEPIHERLPRKIREYAFRYQTGNMFMDWVNAQKSIASSMPIAGSLGLNHKRSW